MMPYMDQVLALLDKRTGMDVTTLGGTVVMERAVEQARHEGGFTSVTDWLAAVQRDEELWRHFLHKVVVGETFFFRYPESYAALVRWAQQRVKKPLRILSLPCSTGEETYSIVIALLKAGLAPHEFSVQGMDINEKFVQQAASGVFHRTSSFRTDDLASYEGYLEQKKGAIHVAEKVRRQVEFKTVNFWQSQMSLEGFDVIFCRNLLIYFDAKRQESALQRLGQWLRHDGLLFLGPAEVPVAGKHGWRSEPYPMAFACRLVGGKDGALPSSASGKANLLITTLGLSPNKLMQPVFPTRSYAHGIPAIEPLKPFSNPAHVEPKSPASAQPKTPEPASPPKPTPTPAVPKQQPTDEPTLAEIREMADRGELGQARALLQQLMQAGTPDAGCYALSGVLEETAGNRGEAEKMFRKALYLDPAHVEAVTHLAWLLKADGRLEAAKNLLARAGRIQAP